MIDPSIDTSAPVAATKPEADRLPREAAWLFSLLIGFLGLSVLFPSDRYVGFGYLTALLFLLLCIRHMRRFDVAIMFFPERIRWPAIPLLFTSLLAVALVFGAMAPTDPRPIPSLPTGAMIYLILVVPVVEEFYFRGLLLEHLTRGLGVARAVLFSTILFALLHWPSGGVYVGAGLGFAACLLAIRAGLVFAVQLHAAWNAFTVIHRMHDELERWILATFVSIVLFVLLAAVLRPCGRGDAHDLAS